jgi:DNA-binding LacI/PurR family transcriptional regulator
MPKKTGSPTIRDVAKLAKVSIATVSRALNQSDAPVAPKTLERIQKAVAKLNFVPHSAARSLSSSKKNTIGLLLPHIGWDDYFPPLLRGVEMGAHENGFDLLIASRRFNDANGYRAIGPHNTDGIVVFTDSLSNEELIELHKKNFPFVLLHRTPPDNLPIPHVQFENKAGARKIVDHLIEVHHCKKIAFLSGPQGNEDSYWREMGYRASMEAHGLKIDSDLIAPGNFEDADARLAVEKWLGKKKKMDAIFAADDDSAFGALEALKDAGRLVPDDVAVVGFDDLPTARFCNPPLTTVRATISDAGYRATQMLAELISGNETQSLALLPTELVIRRSCGCA